MADRVTARVILIADGSIADLRDRLAAILRAVPRGAVAIQIRDKALDGGPLLRLASEAMAVARPAGAPLWINDRIDIAQIVGATGVQLPEAGLPIRIARALVSEDIAIGASRHTEDAAVAAAAEGANIVQLGPIFDTPGKSTIGLDVLCVRRRLPAATQLVAVGGIGTPEQARSAIVAGADAVALIRAWRGEAPDRAVAALVAAVESRSSP